MSADQGRCELAILGAGVIGCALARALGRYAPIGEVLLIEGAARSGTGISSRNSGVVHAGLYYPPGSRKARTCVTGNAQLWAWARSRGVPHRQTGKLVVATEADQEPVLARLLANARACGAELEPVTLAQARALEPELPASVRAACWAPRSGIIDAHALVRSLEHAAVSAGVTFVGAAVVESITPVERGFELVTTRGRVTATRVVNAAGLGAVRLARSLGLDRSLFPARGDYFRLRGPSRWQRLIYPVVSPGAPALGIHLTLGLDGSGRLGPDLEWVGDPDDLDPEPGLAKLEQFRSAAERLLGPLGPDALAYDGCGIRPKLVGPGQPAADFELIEHPRGCWHLLGIESPGLTASLALADEVARCVSSASSPSSGLI